jgi:hypothetical protein
VTRPPLPEQHRQLHDCLVELRRVGERQLQVEAPEDWQAVLKAKQSLLNHVARLNPEVLFLSTQQLIGDLEDFAPEVRTLTEGLEENRALLEEIVAIEDAAEKRLNKQLEEVAHLLADARRSVRLTGLYRGKGAPTTPRFLDSKR